MKKILLISPTAEVEALWVTGEESDEIKHNFPPLALATLAALAPEEKFQVQIWDENVHGRITPNRVPSFECDLVGLTGFAADLPRCSTLAKIFRDRGLPVAIGGPGISSMPHLFRQHFDIVFINEAEETWPRFLHDWDEGSYEAEYRQIEKPDLTNSPMPKWDSIVGEIGHYAMGAVQTTRGCPYDCEFCDVIYLFGRRPRHKPIERVLEEVRVWQRFGKKTVCFNDDEFSGDRKYAKQLLKELIELNNSFDEPLTFTTQISLACTRDDHLLDMLADANFDSVFVGVESANEESLRGANKSQNLKGDMIENIHKFFKRGIGIRAGMMVGFDDDDARIFDLQYEFIQKAGLTSVAINMLKAPLGTKLWARLMREGRVVRATNNLSIQAPPRARTNILPKQLSRVELMEGYEKLMNKVHSWDTFAERVCEFISLNERAPRKPKETEIDIDAMVDRFELGEDARRAMEQIVEHTKRTAPTLMGKVGIIIIQHAKYRETVLKLMPRLRSQIELEASGKVNFAVDRRSVPPSANFRREFDRVMPGLYGRAYTTLTDPSKAPQAVTEAFVDFLVRWGEDFEELQEHHEVFLDELCDRACAAINGESPEDILETNSRPARKVPNVSRLRMGDDIFKAVWLDISELQLKQRMAS